MHHDLIYDEKEQANVNITKEDFTNDDLFRTLLKRYEAEIEDALYKLKCIEDHNLVIPEHVDITGQLTLC